MAGFIIGFDGEEKGAGDRIVRFIEETAIPTTTFAMLQALPNTALWHRLEREGRMLNNDGNINQTTLMNFQPTRPIEDIAREYVDAFWRIYDLEKSRSKCPTCNKSMSKVPTKKVKKGQ